MRWIDGNNACINFILFPHNTHLCNPRMTARRPRITTCHPRITARHPGITARRPRITTYYNNSLSQDDIACYPRFTSRYPGITGRYPGMIIHLNNSSSQDHNIDAHFGRKNDFWHVSQDDESGRPGMTAVVPGLHDPGISCYRSLVSFFQWTDFFFLNRESVEIHFLCVSPKGTARSG